MRIKFLRIFPETCARTWCLFSSSTLNMALGRGSRTTAITSIASSLLIQFSSQLSVLSSQSKAPGSPLRTENRELRTAFSLRQNHRSIFRHRHAMLKMRAETAVGGDCRPLVAQHPGFRLAKIHHRFNGQNHAFAQLGAMTASSIVRHLRFLVQVRPNAMPHKFADDAKAGGLHMLLHRRSHIAHRIADD